MPNIQFAMMGLLASAGIWIGTNPAAVVRTELGVRISVLAPGLFRVQRSVGELDGIFDERRTFQVVNRNLSVPQFSVLTNTSELAAVSTEIANVSVTPTSMIFGCAASRVKKWEWNFDQQKGDDSIVDNMPINSNGMFVMNDSDTARLTDWWEFPIAASSVPTPPPTPSPNTCENVRLHTEVAAGATRCPAYPNGLSNQTQQSCCAECNNSQRKGGAGACVAWVFATDSHECWLMSAVTGLQANGPRVYGGADPSPPGPDAQVQVPTDLYLMCYGDDFLQGMQQLTSITGKGVMMPEVAYGVWYSGCCIQDLYTQKAVSEDILGVYKQLDLPLDVLVLDFFWHRPGWGGYSWNNATFPDSQGFVQSLRDGSNAYGSPLALLLNHHPDQAVISPQSEDRYAAFAAAMGEAEGGNASFACDLYNASYVRALQSALLAPIEDYPWIDCATCSRTGPVEWPLNYKT